MASYWKGWLASHIGWVVLGAGCLCVVMPRPIAASPINTIPSSGTQPTLRPADEAFSKDLEAFVASARKAEEQSDPLKRCLAYPDPPGSHWTHEAVAAYCHYRFQPTITFAEAKSLIQQGKTEELDRRLDEALQAQLTQPDARGRLDHIFINDFQDHSMAMRSLLDAWKRNSPNSAYAYAASGYAYVQLAHDQRGGEWAQDTPQAKMDAMDRLLQFADDDLKHAIHLNPKITPVYVAMLHAAGLSLGRGYARQAMTLGLKADPSNWSIYEEMMWLAEPQWFGSRQAMQGVADLAVKHAKQNPLLWMEKKAVERYEANATGCGCAPPPQAKNFPAAYDELAISGELIAAGKAAAEQGAAPMAVVYLSEGIRFQPTLKELRQQRAEELAMAGEQQLALDEVNDLIASFPDDEHNYQVRGYVYVYMNDLRHGTKDLETALAMNPDDDKVLGMLGSIYSQSREWDKAWDIADRIIRKYPDSPGGWEMRATIEEEQPRAGLEDTYRYFVEHFNNDPKMQWQINHMHEVLTKTPQTGMPAPAQVH